PPPTSTAARRPGSRSSGGLRSSPSLPARSRSRSHNRKATIMTFGVGNGRLMALACALAATGGALAAPRAAELGPETAMAEPVGGYVGRLSVAPEHGPVGTPLQV